VDLTLATHDSQFDPSFSRWIQFPTLRILRGRSSTPAARLAFASYNTRVIRKTIQTSGVSAAGVFVNAAIDTLFECRWACKRKVAVGYNVFLSGMNSVLLDFMDRFGARYAVERIVAHTRSHKTLYQRIGIDEEKISIIPHCVDTRRIRNESEMFLEAASVSTTKPIIFYGGRLAKEKGIRELVSSYEWVCKRVPAALTLVGDGPLTDWVLKRKKVIERRDGHAEISVFSYQSLPRFLSRMAKATIVAIPSYSEPFGIVALEAMSLGKPVLATRCGGTAEIITDRQDGMLINPHDQVQMREGFLQLLQDERMRRRLGSSALGTVNSRYEVSRVASRFLKFLKGDV
jgi:glycosyltransferase involved in cell wall biosynthesis